MVLRCRKLSGKPVTGRGGCVEEAFDFMLPRRFQAYSGAIDVRPMIIERSFDGGHDVPNAGDMEHPINPLHGAIHSLRIADIGLVKRKPILSFQMRNIFASAGGEIVDPNHVMSRGDQMIDDMAADKSGRTRHERGFCNRKGSNPLFTTYQMPIRERLANSLPGALYKYRSEVI